MTLRSFATWVGVLLLPALLVRADEKNPEEILQSKGLIKLGTRYVLKADGALPEALRNMRAVQHQVEICRAKRTQVEREITAAEDQLLSWIEKNKAATERLEKTSKEAYASYNVVVDEVNAIRQKIRAAEPAIAARKKDLQAIPDPSADYTAAVTKLSDTMEDIAGQYEKLATDQDVKRAIDKLNETAKPKVKLGPSEQFVTELPLIRRLHQAMVITPIRFEIEGGVPQVSVTLNGTTKIAMILDSGAATVTLTAETAKRVGLLPEPGDHLLNLHTADGKVTVAHEKRLKSVRLGPFTVENVECAILPPEMKKASNLLGGTFLRHFIYKMDLAAGIVRMSQVSGKPAVDAQETAPPASTGPTAPATQPIESTPLTCTVTAGTDWTDSTFQVQAGRCYRIAAKGKWTNATGTACGPEGVCPPRWFSTLGPQPGMTAEQKDASYLGQHPRSALLARIDDDKLGFYVGTDQSFIAPKSGRMGFRMNDGIAESSARGGMLDVTFNEVRPQWLDGKSTTTIFARIDASDLLHITPDGIYWEWGGQWGRVGEHDGHYPTIINGILWWPKWIDAKHTETLNATSLRPSGQIRLLTITVKRGKVELDQSLEKEVILRFSDNGLGSSEVGCSVSFPQP